MRCRWKFLLELAATNKHLCWSCNLLKLSGIKLFSEGTNLLLNHADVAGKGAYRLAHGWAVKGIVFNLLEEVVVQHYGEDTWDSLLSTTNLDGSYTSLGSYPDEHIAALVAAAANALDLTQFDVLRWFGNQAMPLLFERYPSFFAGQTSCRPFLLSVNHIIHPEVRKIYPGAQVPTFKFSDVPDGRLMMGYDSPRRLCALAQGFAEGAATHYGESLHFEHQKCMHRGDECCVCAITFLSSSEN